MLIMKAVNVVRHGLNAIKIRNIPADHIADYDVACQSYDDYYGRYLGKKTLDMFEAIPIKKGGNYIDVPCGTGIITAPLAEKVGSDGNVTAVDLSYGMLEKCRENVTTNDNDIANIDYKHQDAYEYLQTLPSEAYDGVICAWGICYMQWQPFVDQVRRILKHDGVVAIIENREDTLKELFAVYTSCLIDYPYALNKKMVANLPKNAQALIKLLKNKHFSILKSWEGDVDIPCNSGAEVMEYVNNAGVSSGFLDAVDSQVYPEIEARIAEKFDALLDAKNKTARVTHKFSCVIGIKQ